MGKIVKNCIPTFVSGQLDYDDITHSPLVTFREKVGSFSASQKAELMKLRQTFKKRVSVRIQMTCWLCIYNFWCLQYHAKLSKERKKAKRQRLIEENAALAAELHELGSLIIFVINKVFS